MKVFIDPEESLIINIPDDWYFCDMQNQPFSFSPY
jgi:hypothetical protein